MPVCLLAAALVVTSIGATAEAQSPVGGFDPGANAEVRVLAVQADGKVLVGGNFTMLGGGGTGTTVRNRLGRLNADGTLDTSFNPGANGNVYALAVQPDGKILVAGIFSMLGGGGTGTNARTRIGRLNADGSIDTTFNPGANGTVIALAVQPDGKILVGGAFTGLGGGSGTTPRNRIGRLNADGSVDAGFDPGADADVGALALQPDGKILVGGLFTMLGGGTGTTTRNRIGRLDRDGSVDAGFNPGANSFVQALAVQPDGKILVGGDFTGLGGGSGTTLRNRIGRLNANGSVDSGFNPGANGRVDDLALQPDGKILLSGFFSGLGGGTGTTLRKQIGRLNPDGGIDASFNPGVAGNPFALAVQTDGKVLVGGFFTALGGGTGTTPRANLGRLHADGSVETDFNPGANSGIVSLALQADGKIVVGGSFTMLGGGGTGTTARDRIGRLHPDGALDTTFNPGADLTVLALAVQTDGKILVGGAFSTLGGGARTNLGRLNADGSLDTGFNPAPNGFVRALVVQSDGKILVGGDFTSIAGGVRNYVARLNANGTLDAIFAPSANGPVNALALETDGDILLGGSFTTVAGVARNRVARVNTNGALGTFAPGANNWVRAIAVQADGKIVLGGDFTGLGGTTGTTTRNYIGRVLTDGTVDSTFNPGANSTVQALVLEVSGNIVVGGSFTTLGGGGTGTTTRNRIGRLDNSGVLDATFDPGADNQVYGLAIERGGSLIVAGAFSGLGGGTGTTLRSSIGRVSATTPLYESFYITASALNWFRAQAGPKFARTTFEWSSNGVTWTPLGSGTFYYSGTNAETSGVNGLSLPLNQLFYVRLRGFYGTGLDNGSESIVEVVRQAYVSSSLQAPAFAAPPGNQTVGVGDAASFTASATGYPLPTYSWELSTNGGSSWSTVPNAAPYIGVNAATLYITSATAAMNGTQYRALALNSQGNATGSPALLTVSAPANIDLAINGDFSSGMTGWIPFATPDASYIVSNVSGGKLQFYRNPPPAGTSNQAVVLQQTGQPVPAQDPVTAFFTLGNTSTVRKRISVLLHDSDFSDLSVCTFWLPPSSFQTYGMETHTTEAWNNLTMSFYAASVNQPGDTGFYQLDDVRVYYLPGAVEDRTHCLDPTKPAPPGGAAGPELLSNGDFSAGTSSWTTYGTITSQVSNGVFEFIKPTSVEPSGVILQPTGQAMTANQLLTATFDLGNSSAVRKRVTVIVHDLDFSDLSACTFWIPPGQALSTYTYRTFATQAWTNATVSVYPATVGADQWIRLDNVSLKRTPSATITGTECLEPGAPAPLLVAKLAAGGTADAPSLLAYPVDTPGARAVADATPATVGIDRWLTDGFVMADEFSTDRAGPGWMAVATGVGPQTLTGLTAVDLTDASSAWLTFESWLTTTGSLAEVQVSVDGVSWETLLVVAPSDNWVPVEIDLTEFTSGPVYVRFVLDGAPPLDPADPDTWRVGDLRVETTGALRGRR